MTENEAVVIRGDGDYVWLDFNGPSACAGCGQAAGCGLSDGRGKPAQRVRNTIGARVGDTVIVGAPDGTVLRAVFHTYLLPLALALAGAATGMALGGDPGAVVGVLLGLTFGWLMLRVVGRREPALEIRLKHAVVQFQRNPLS